MINLVVVALFLLFNFNYLYAAERDDCTDLFTDSAAAQSSDNSLSDRPRATNAHIVKVGSSLFTDVVFRSRGESFVISFERRNRSFKAIQGEWLKLSGVSEFLADASLKGKKFLDIAMGDGQLVKDLQPIVTKTGRAIGVDIRLSDDQKQIEFNDIFYEADAAKLSFSDNAFDITHCWEGPLSYIHLKTVAEKNLWRQIFQEQVRVTADGGYVLFTGFFGDRKEILKIIQENESLEVLYPDLSLIETEGISAQFVIRVHKKKEVSLRRSAKGKDAPSKAKNFWWLKLVKFYADDLHRLATLGPIAKYLASKKINWSVLRSKSQRLEALDGYFEGLLIKFTGTSFEADQDQSLAASLLVHGFSRDFLGGYQALNVLSGDNKARIMSKIKPIDGSDPEIEEVLSKVGFHFVHNSLNDLKGNLSPIFSSKQIQGIGLEEGLDGLSGAPFNSEVLKSHDNVFFFLDIKDKSASGDQVPSIHSRYGKAELVVQSQYAEQRGWISAFIMNPPEVIDMLYLLDPDLYVHVKQALKLQYPEDAEREAWDMLTNLSDDEVQRFVHSNHDIYERVQGISEEGNSARERMEEFCRYHRDRNAILYRQLGDRMKKMFPEKKLRPLYDVWNVVTRKYNLDEVQLMTDLNILPVLSKLHVFDFRVDDFKEIIIAQLRSAFKHLRNNDPNLFKLELDEFRVALKTNDLKKLHMYLEKYVYKPLQMPMEYELKVPVALPKDQYISIERSHKK